MTTEFTLQMQTIGTDDGHMIDCMAICLTNKCLIGLCNSSHNLDWMISLPIALPWHLLGDSGCHRQLRRVPAGNEQKENYFLFPFIYLEYYLSILPAHIKFQFWISSTISEDKNGMNSKFSILQPHHWKRKKSSCSVTGRQQSFWSSKISMLRKEKKKHYM